MPGQKIGELNGRWALLAKCVLVAVPLLAPPITAAVVWMVVQQFQDIAFRSEGERYTEREALRDHQNVTKDAMIREATIAADLRRELEQTIAAHASLGGHIAMEQRMRQMESNWQMQQAANGKFIEALEGIRITLARIEQRLSGANRSPDG